MKFKTMFIIAITTITIFTFSYFISYGANHGNRLALNIDTYLDNQKEEFGVFIGKNIENTKEFFADNYPNATAEIEDLFMKFSGQPKQ